MPFFQSILQLDGKCSENQADASKTDRSAKRQGFTGFAENQYLCADS